MTDIAFGGMIPTPGITVANAETAALCTTTAAAIAAHLDESCHIFTADPNAAMDELTYEFDTNPGSRVTASTISGTPTAITGWLSERANHAKTIIFTDIVAAFALPNGKGSKAAGVAFAEQLARLVEESGVRVIAMRPRENSAGKHHSTALKEVAASQCWVSSHYSRDDRIILGSRDGSITLGGGGEDEHVEIVPRYEMAATEAFRSGGYKRRPNGPEAVPFGGGRDWDPEDDDGERLSTPTVRHGIRFRSRLEADWYDAFRDAGLRVVHEPHGFSRGGFTYLPDLLLPDLGLWVEVKGVMDFASMEKLTVVGRHLPRPLDYSGPDVGPLAPRVVVVSGRVPGGAPAAVREQSLAWLGLTDEGFCRVAFGPDGIAVWPCAAPESLAAWLDPIAYRPVVRSPVAAPSLPAPRSAASGGWPADGRSGSGRRAGGWPVSVAAPGAAS